MRKAALAIAAIAALVSACGGTHPSEAACKTAMKAEYAQAISNPNGPPGTEPAACKGLPAAELRKLAGQVLAGN